MSNKIKTVLQTTDGEIHQDAAKAERHQARIDLEAFINAYNNETYNEIDIAEFIEDIVDNFGHIHMNAAVTFADLMKRAK